MCKKNVSQHHKIALFYNVSVMLIVVSNPCLGGKIFYFFYCPLHLSFIDVCLFVIFFHFLDREPINPEKCKYTIKPALIEVLLQKQKPCKWGVLSKPQSQQGTVFTIQSSLLSTMTANQYHKCCRRCIFHSVLSPSPSFPSHHFPHLPQERLIGQKSVHINLKPVVGLFSLSLTKMFKYYQRVQQERVGHVLVVFLRIWFDCLEI